ncbi:MAG: AAA family ATPase [Pirellulaceae bacterium]
MNLSNAPAWLIDQLDALAGHKPATTINTTATGGKIPAGQRNSSAASYAGALRRVGASESELLAALRQWSKDRCDPPLDSNELAIVAKSIGRYEAGDVANSTGKAAVLVCFDQIEPEEVQWVWPGRIPAGKMSLLFGDPSLGKSFIAFDWAARISRGREWPDGAENKIGSVIILSAEDDAADTIAPRLINADADMSRIYCLQGVHFGDPEKPQTFSLESDLPALETAIAATPGCRLLIIDPISAYTGSVDTHKNSEVRSLLTPLRDVAERTGAAVLLISHLNKAGGQSALHRASGSIGIIAACRAGLLAAKDKDDDARRLLLPAKNNLGPEIGGLAYRIVEPGKVEWEAGKVTATADEALSPDQPKQQSKEKAAAVDWLRELLKDGELPSSHVLDHGLEAGFTPAVLRRAKAQGGIEAKLVGFGRTGRWHWFDPCAEITKSHAS